MYGEGISKSGELLDLGVKSGIVEKSGAWFSYDSERMGQGRENARQFLKDNPAIAAQIEQGIRESAGLLSERLITDDSAEEAGDDVDVLAADEQE
jgi:recombination protein RecA